MSEIRIRVAGLKDIEKIRKIYAPYVTGTAISFEANVPTMEEFQNRMINTLKKYPYVVAERDCEVVGYSYTSPFVGRAAYDWCAEPSIYVRQDMKKSGVGKKLYGAIEKISKAQNILTLNVCIGYPEKEDEYLTRNSAQFHEHMGYRWIGEFHKCGYKFGRWYNMVWMEKEIGEHIPCPEPIIPFSQLDKDKLALLGIEVEH